MRIILFLESDLQSTPQLLHYSVLGPLFSTFNNGSTLSRMFSAFLRNILKACTVEHGFLMRTTVGYMYVFNDRDSLPLAKLRGLIKKMGEDKGTDMEACGNGFHYFTTLHTYMHSSLDRAA